MQLIRKITYRGDGWKITQTKTKILTIENLVIKFKLRGQVLTAIRNISLDLYKGESLAIVGESGSGKSVLVKSIMGLLDKNGYIDQGKIIYKDHDIANSKQRTIG